MKYKVGDKVRVREDLRDGKTYGGMEFVSEMNQFKGRKFTITNIVNNMYFLESTFDWLWTDEMFGFAENQPKTLEELGWKRTRHWDWDFTVFSKGDATIEIYDDESFVAYVFDFDGTHRFKIEKEVHEAIKFELYNL